MAKQIEKLTELKKSPWALWSNGSAYQAEFSKDFTNARTFKSRLYHYAARKQLAVRVQQVNDNTIEFQFSKKAKKRTKRMKQAS